MRQEQDLRFVPMHDDRCDAFSGAYLEEEMRTVEHCVRMREGKARVHAWTHCSHRIFDESGRAAGQRIARPDSR
jgi:L-ascorbate metabolism protein UlaG (beta-lactamase superfamily)